MTDDLLRETYAAWAGAVRPDPAAYDRVLARRARRRVLRWAAPAAATAAVATTVAVAFALAPSRAPEVAPLDPLAPPSHFALVAGGVPAVVSSDGSQSYAGLRGAPLTALAAVGDGETFYAVRFADCTSTLLRLAVADGRVAETPVADGTVRGRVGSLAVTRDGRRLALATRPYFVDDGCTGGVGSHQVSVRDVTGGTVATFDGPDARNAGWLAFAPDGTRLAYGTVSDSVDTTVRVADIPGTGTRAVLSARRLVDCVVRGIAFRSRDELAVARICREAVEVTPVDLATRAQGAPLFTVDLGGLYVLPGVELAFDPSGRHALLAVNGATGDLYRWDGGAPVELDRDATLIAW